MKVTFDEKDLTELTNFLQELPLKFGLPLLNFVNKKVQEQNKQEEIPVEEAK